MQHRNTNTVMVANMLHNRHGLSLTALTHVKVEPENYRSPFSFIIFSFICSLSPRVMVTAACPSMHHMEGTGDVLDRKSIHHKQHTHKTKKQQKPKYHTKSRIKFNPVNQDLKKYILNATLKEICEDFEVLL